MVKVTAILLASFAVAPLVFATANPADAAVAPSTRTVDNPDLEARDPSPEPFKKLWRKARRFVRNHINQAQRLLRNPMIGKALPWVKTAASIVVRDENGDLYIRELDLSDLADLSERDLEDLDLILDARDFEDFEDLDTREPRKKKWGGAFRKLRSIARQASPFAQLVPGAGPAVSLLAGREFDEDGFDVRDYEDLVDFLEREFEDDLDLDAREPWWGQDVVNKAKQVHQQGAGVLKQVNDANNWLSNIGLREFDEDFGLEEREFDDEFDLDAREPWWGSNLVRKAKKAHQKGAGILNQVNDANRWLNRVGIRDFEDDMEERSYDDIDALD